MHCSGVAVLYTSPEPTLAALRTAQQLRRPHGAPVRLLVVLHVPYPLPLSSPPVPVGFTELQMRRLASQVSADVRVEMYLRRDRREVLSGCLKPGSLVVLGSKRKLWGNTEQKLARWLQQNGHSVVLAAPGEEAGKRTLIHSVLQFRMPNSSH